MRRRHRASTRRCPARARGSAARRGPPCRRVEDAAARGALGDYEHPLVERVRLGVLREEVRQSAGTSDSSSSAQLVARLLITPRGGRVERPPDISGYARPGCRCGARALEDPGVPSVAVWMKSACAIALKELLEPAPCGPANTCPAGAETSRPVVGGTRRASHRRRAARAAP